MDRCEVCGRYGTLQGHHIIHRSQSKAMIKCPHNIIKLCLECHGKVHSSRGREFHLYLKKYYYKKLLELLINEFYSEDEIKILLEIGDNATRSLCKSLNRYKEGYKSSDVIHACMGFKNEFNEVL